ncbi:hypothetical protein [Salipiger mangrovisoli]|uniref:Uncharacterized protein n=1 Tax=Salipiger mangrovisoli TaxID=2865933 RepID=A0ABR9X034_9RHOB|nr:hypothetical protein [Salipiger mangrovisoli]MBE9636910.1 hypothetical protein [Salipiger mangrovisoli]
MNGRDGEGAQAPFHLVLAEPEDATALRVCSALRRVGRVEFVTPDEIFMAPHWAHDPLGSSRVELASGLVLTDANLLSVFNRVRRVAPLHFAAAAPEDQRYAGDEFFALLISWLTGFGARCVNPPHPGSVAGFAARSAAEDRLRLGADLHAASRARHLGLGTPLAGFPDAGAPLRPGGPGQHRVERPLLRVLIAGDALSQDLPEALRNGLRAEMLRRGLRLAEVTLEETAAGWQPVLINPVPEAASATEVSLIVGLLADVAEAWRGAA